MCLGLLVGWRFAGICSERLCITVVYRYSFIVDIKFWNKIYIPDNGEVLEAEMGGIPN